MQEMRGRSGCLYFERRADGPLLRAAMNRGGMILGLLADQSSNGLRGPFLGHDCSTTLAPAVFALRYQCELFTGFCYRVALAKWRIELGEKFPRTKTTGPVRPEKSWATSTAPLKPPSAATRPTGSGSTAAGNRTAAKAKMEDGG